MTREIITDVLLALAVLTVAAAALGVAVMPDAALTGVASGAVAAVDSAAPVFEAGSTGV